MSKPSQIFDRDQEWSDLERLATLPDRGPSIGVVYGRRRQGKSFLLRALVGERRGLYFQALEEEREPALAHVGELVAADAGIGGTVVYTNWISAFAELVRRAGPDRPIILDEFPYLVAKSPELPSVIQDAFDSARSDQGRSFRLLLCGSAMSVMTTLLSGQRALRGRVSLEALIRPFDYRQAAAYWGIADPQTAFLVHAVVGGTPGYRALLPGPAPQTPGDFEQWLFDGMLNPSSALFREADYLLTEDPAISDRALYQSVLAAIAEGHNTRSAIGGVLGREDAALRHPLLVLERASFIRRDEDLWRSKRPLLRLEDPYLRFHFAVVRRDLARFEARLTAEAWTDASTTFHAQVVGPQFEQLARTWARSYASAATLGGRPSVIGFTQVNDASARSRIELDVVAVAGNPNADRPLVLALGEAKGGVAVRTIADLRKLERGKAILGERAEVDSARLLLFSRSGFERDLLDLAAQRDDIELVDIERLYRGN
ncbi:MAG: AAA family ATPase [Candidatus Limnocylindrales bacterium]